MSSDKRLLSKPAVSPSFPIIWKDNVAYERARVGRVFNYRRPSRFPIAVVEATTEAHVVEAVKLANQLGCRVSVRSGGHSWAAWSVRDDAVLIDFGKLFHFHLDAETGVLEASPSMTGRMVNRLLEPHGRLFPGGHCPDVALGGFLLQGGMGWNCRVSKLYLMFESWANASRTGALPANACWPSMWLQPMARSCTATKRRTATCSGPAAEPDLVGYPRVSAWHCS